MASYTYTTCDMCGCEIRSELYSIELKNCSDWTNDIVHAFKCDLCKACAKRIKGLMNKADIQIHFIKTED